MKKVAVVVLGIGLHIAGLEVADLMLSSRMIACASGDAGTCVILLEGQESLFETVARARPQLGRARWLQFLKDRGLHDEE